MFYPVVDVDLEGTTVVVPSISIGNVPQLAVDLLVNTLRPVFVGYIHHECLIPVVGHNAYHNESKQLSSSCEVYYMAGFKLIFLQFRGAVMMGCEETFSRDLMEWLISLNVSQLIILMSVTAEVRKDKDLQGCQIRYTLPSEFREELEAKLQARGWSEYDNPEADGSEDMNASNNSRLYVPSGGFGQHLYNVVNQSGRCLLGLMMYAYEGDNESEAITMADALASLQSMEVSEWKKPVSWGLMYGSGPPPDVY